jgi:nitroimidazol reductase NimA-like FMN-containing flavoprotein (pyridoxamine 5'-phosphate oxidase superfamily)
MRIKDRERGAEFAWNLFDNAPYAVLAMTDENGEPYSIPISPVRISNAIYFHGAKEGKKAECIAANPSVFLTVVGHSTPVPGEFTIVFSSANFKGNVSVEQDEKVKLQVMRLVAGKYTPGNMENFVDERIMGAMPVTTVFKIDVTEAVGKEKIYDAEKEQALREKVAKEGGIV